MSGAVAEPARVVSVNVGGPRTVAWGGRRVRTSIWKTPVEGRVPASGINLDGDAQSDRRVHGGPDKAVYAYAAEDYDWWEHELGDALGPGTFGENLTVVGIDLAAAVVGEHWSVGTARLVVTQPRLPCFKLGLRMGAAAFVGRFESARRFGVYLRIEAAGHIGAGDVIVRTAGPDHGLTPYQIADIHGAPTPGGLERLLDAAEVPGQWREWARRQIDRAGGGRLAGG